MSMTDMLRRAAERHRTVALAMISASAQTLIVRVPAAKPQTTGAPMFADLSASTAAPIPKGPFQCLWHEVTANPNPNSVDALMVGRYPKAHAYAVLSLADVLIDSDEPLQETWFHKADSVEHDGQLYEVLGFDRSGMAVMDPYLLTVVFASEVRRRAG